MLFKIATLLLLTAFATSDQECRHRDYGNVGTVCVCDANYCDTISPIEQLPSSQYVIYTSNLEGFRFKKQVGSFQQSHEPGVSPAVLDHSLTYQSIHGFGGCFTDATGINFNSLDDRARDHLMRSYFSEDGIEYNIGRVPIGGTDFSTRGYSYLDTEEPDFELENYALQPEDFEYKIPVIKEAMELSGNMILMASAWTAPKWMKTNGEYAGLGFLIDEMYQLWADYFVKFLDLYKEYGLEFWAITTGNEPSLALPFMQINTVGWIPWKINKWIRRNLGPTLSKSPYSNITIIAHDDQRIFIPLVDLIFEDKEARDYIGGIGVHWYWDNWVPATWLTQVHNKYPEKFIIGTEASAGNLPWQAAISLGSWERGELYAVDIMQDLQNWMTGWLDWCLALDEEGGPSYISNFVDSPVIVNATGGEFYKQPLFYAIGHFSKFLPRGSVKIEAPNDYNGLLLVAFDRPDGGTFVGVVNQEERPIGITIVDGDRGVISTEISAKSFNSIVFW